MRQYTHSTPVLFILFLFIISCKPGGNKTTASSGTVFTRLNGKDIGLDFANMLEENGKFDVFRYRNYYNGGGVAIGDINNDGLADVYMSANCQPNKLFLNKGNFTFEDITEKAGVGGKRAWSTGVTMADVNGDGWLDIYVCNSGDVEGDDQQNELFINKGGANGQWSGGFEEQADLYGLDDKGYGTHAVFFDYDLDGDLDCYVLNNSFRPVSTLGETNVRNVRDEKGGHKLYKNDNGKFRDISEQAGIYGSVIGFGLGVTVGDVNLDGWPDLYVSNDFHERDYFYVNDRKGGFKESLTQYFDQISLSSMGADLADINNDGLPEIFSTDMLPGDDRRLKQTSTFQNYDIYLKRVQLDYYHQFMSNMLHLHNGLAADGTMLPMTEIGELAGVASTDWSWGALMADFDNDGWRDILVCNGIYKDVTDQDFLNFLSSDANMEKALRGEFINFKQFIDKIPSERISNYMFSRTQDAGGLRFDNVTQNWGLGEPTHSNGAAYGDLDNDGDLDLVLNNSNMEAFVYRNETEKSGKKHTLRIQFKGEKQNAFGVGALLYVFRGDQILTYEHYPMRGFQSSMDYTAVLGLGDNTAIDSAIVWWPGGKRQVVRSLQADQIVVLSAADATPGPGPAILHTPAKTILKDETASSGLRFEHKENIFSDFDNEQMTYTMRSAEGPALATGDLNGDGLDDVFIGGAKGQVGAVFVQKPDGNFRPDPQPALNTDAASEDTDAVWFDADGDGDQDLYVASGGSDFFDNAPLLQGRLYLNEKGKLQKKPDNLPALNSNTSCVRPADVDGDGDLDLFLGSRCVPAYYGQPADSYLLENDGKGKFTDVTRAKASVLRKFGMVTDACWTDIDGDKRPDLVVVGEWMPVTVLRNDNGRLVKMDNQLLANSNGLWYRIAPADLDGDGDTDFVLGNIGDNTRFRASATDPMSILVNDFDKNGSLDQFYCYRENGKTHTMHLLHEVVKRIPGLKKNFLYYKDYAGKSIEEILPPDWIAQATKLEAFTLRTSIVLNEGNGKWTLKPLPDAVQTSSTQGIAIDDFDRDGKIDLLLTGNFFYNKPEMGRFGGNYGTLLSGDGKGDFTPQPLSSLGVFTREQVRRTVLLKGKNEKSRIVLAQNNAAARVWSY